MKKLTVTLSAITSLFVFSAHSQSLPESAGFFFGGGFSQLGTSSVEWFNHRNTEGYTAIATDSLQSSWFTERIHGSEAGAYATFYLGEGEKAFTKSLMVRLGYRSERGMTFYYVSDTEIDEGVFQHQRSSYEYLRTRIKADVAYLRNYEWRALRFSTGLGVTARQSLGDYFKFYELEYIDEDPEGLGVPVGEHNLLEIDARNSTSVSLYIPLSVGVQFLERFEARMEYAFALGYDFPHTAPISSHFTGRRVLFSMGYLLF